MDISTDPCSAIAQLAYSGSAPLTIAATDRQRRQHTYVYKRRGTTIQSKDIDNEWDADNDLSEGDELDNDHSDNGDGG